VQIWRRESWETVGGRVVSLGMWVGVKTKNELLPRNKDTMVVYEKMLENK
jgi:hypothetical protein